MKQIPEIILLNSRDGNIDWVEEHDLIEPKGFPYDEKNQFKWWQKNCEIRLAFNSIEKEIKEKKKTRKPISPKLVSWTNIAKLSNCDRNTVKLEKRLIWTSQWKEKLEELIKKYNSELINSLPLGSEQDEKSKLKELEKKLNDSRTEIAIWVSKYNDIKKDLQNNEPIISNQVNTIANKEKEIQRLKDLIMHLEGQIPNQNSNVKFFTTN
jgi:hypothetical protein